MCKVSGKIKQQICCFLKKSINSPGNIPVELALNVGDFMSSTGQFSFRFQIVQAFIISSWSTWCVVPMAPPWLTLCWCFFRSWYYSCSRCCCSFWCSFRCNCCCKIKNIILATKENLDRVKLVLGGPIAPIYSFRAKPSLSLLLANCHLSSWYLVPNTEYYFSPSLSIKYTYLGSCEGEAVRGAWP